MADSDVAATLHVLAGEPGRTIGIVELLRALAGGPLRAKTREQPADLVAVDAVTTLVWTTIGSIFDVGARNGLGYDGSQFTDTVVFFCPTNIKGLVMDGFLRCFQRGENGGDNVANVNDGTPRCAIALYVHSAGGVGRCHQVI